MFCNIFLFFFKNYIYIRAIFKVTIINFNSKIYKPYELP